MLERESCFLDGSLEIPGQGIEREVSTPEVQRQVMRKQTSDEEPCTALAELDVSQVTNESNKPKKKRAKGVEKTNEQRTGTIL